MNKSNKFSSEVRERALRLVLVHRGEFPSLWLAVESIAPKIGCVPQTLLTWVKRVEIDTGIRRRRDDLGRPADEGARAREQRTAQGQRNPQGGKRVFRPGGARPPIQILRELIDEHRETFGVEPICKVLQISPSGYRRRAALRREPERRCARAQNDNILAPEIKRVWQANMQVYGAEKVWQQLAREGTAAARCTVERLMKRLGLRGVMRAKSYERRSAIAGRHAHWTRSTGSSRPTGRTSFGSRTSRTSRPGKAGSTWPSSSTSTPGASWAGASAVR